MLNKKFLRGEISTILTIGILIFMGITALSSSLILKNKNKSQPKAAVSTEQCRNDIKEGDPCEEIGAENWCIKCNEPRIKGPCNNGDGGVGFPFKCIQTDEGLKWKEQNSLGECNLTCTAPEQQIITNENSPSCQDAANPARADQTPSGYTWQAICGKTCNTDADCDPGANGARWCYGFKEGNKCLKLVQLNSTGTGGDCNDNPEGPPVDPKHPEAKYKWTALCNEKACTDSKQCPIGANGQAGWCYGFGRSSADWRCLRMDPVDTGSVAMTSSCKTLYDKIITSTTNGGIAAICSNSKYNPVADLNKDKKANSEDLNLFNSTTNLGQNDGQCAVYLNATHNPCVLQQSGSSTGSEAGNGSSTGTGSTGTGAGTGSGSGAGSGEGQASATPTTTSPGSAVKSYTYKITGEIANPNYNNNIPDNIFFELHNYNNENELAFDFGDEQVDFTIKPDHSFTLINNIVTTNPPVSCSLITLVHGKRTTAIGPFDCKPDVNNNVGTIDINYNPPGQASPVNSTYGNECKLGAFVTNNNIVLGGVKLYFYDGQYDEMEISNLSNLEIINGFTDKFGSFVSNQSYKDGRIMIVAIKDGFETEYKSFDLKSPNNCIPEIIMKINQPPQPKTQLLIKNQNQNKNMVIKQITFNGNPITNQQEDLNTNGNLSYDIEGCTGNNDGILITYLYSTKSQDVSKMVYSRIMCDKLNSVEIN